MGATAVFMSPDDQRFLMIRQRRSLAKAPALIAAEKRREEVKRLMKGR